VAESIEQFGEFHAPGWRGIFSITGGIVLPVQAAGSHSLGIQIDHAEAGDIPFQGRLLRGACADSQGLSPVRKLVDEADGGCERRGADGQIAEASGAGRCRRPRVAVRSSSTALATVSP
jgi:hypothetical protein